MPNEHEVIPTHAAADPAAPVVAPAFASKRHRTPLTLRDRGAARRAPVATIAGPTADTPSSVWHTIARWSLSTLLVLTPVIIIPGFPLPPARMQQAIAILLTLLAGMSWAIGCLATAQVVLPRLPLPVAIALVVFTLSVAGSIARSPAPAASIWGIHGGEVSTILTIGIGVLSLLLLATLLRTPRELRRASAAFRTGAILALAVSVASMVTQLVVRRPFFGITNATFTPLSSFASTTAVLAAAFLLALATRTFTPRTRPRNALVTASVIALFLGIAIVHHPAVLSGLAVALVGVLLVWLVRSRTRSPHLLTLNVLVGLLTITILLGLVGAQLVRILPIPAEVRPTTTSTVAVAVRALRGNPLAIAIGTGPNTFRDTYLLHRPASVSQSPFWNIAFEQGASTLLTLGVEFGLLGAIALLVWVIALLVAAVRAAWGADDRAPDVTIGAAAAFIGLLVISALVPLNGIVLLLLFAIGGLLAAATVIGGREPRPPIVIRLDAHPRALVGSLCLVGAIVAALLLAVAVGQRYATAVAVATARAAHARQPDRARLTAVVTRALARAPDDATARLLSQLHIEELLAEVRRTDRDRPTGASVLQRTFDAAVSAAERAVAWNRASHENWAALADVYRHAAGFVEGAATRAITHYETADTRFPTSPIHPFRIAEVELLRADHDPKVRDAALRSAVDRLRESLQRRPDFLDAALLLAQVHERARDPREAIAVLTAALARFPDHPGILLKLGIARLRSDDLDGAKDALTRLLRVQPNTANAQFILGQIAERQGDRAEAIRQYETVLRLNPGHAEVERKLRELRGEIPGTTRSGTVAPHQ